MYKVILFLLALYTSAHCADATDTVAAVESPPPLTTRQVLVKFGGYLDESIQKFEDVKTAYGTMMERRKEITDNLVELRKLFPASAPVPTESVASIPVTISAEAADPLRAKLTALDTLGKSLGLIHLPKADFVGFLNETNRRLTPTHELHARWQGPLDALRDAITVSAEWWGEPDYNPEISLGKLGISASPDLTTLENLRAFAQVFVGSNKTCAVAIAQAIIHQETLLLWRELTRRFAGTLEETPSA